MRTAASLRGTGAHTDTHTPVPYAYGGVAPRQVLRNPAGLDEALGDVPRVAQVNSAAAAAAAAAMEECGRSHRQPIRRIHDSKKLHKCVGCLVSSAS